MGRLSLLEHAVASAREARRLDRFVVSTDDAEIAEAARRAGAEVPFLRPPELATDHAGMVPVLQHAVRWLESASRVRPQLVVTLQPTSPFRTGADIDRAIAMVRETGADSVQTLTVAAYHPYFMKVLEGDRARPLYTEGRNFVRRQDAPPVYQPSGSVYVTRHDVLMESGRVTGEDNRGLVLGFEASLKIDDSWELLLAEAMVRAGLAPLPEERR